MEENDQTTEEQGASKPRLPFALFDGAMSGLQTALHTVGGLAAAPFKRGDEPEAGAAQAEASGQDEASSFAAGQAGADQTDDTPAPSLAETELTDASPTALAAALDAQGTADLAARAGGEGQAASIIDRMPRADDPSGDRQPAPDEELGPEPFTPQVGP